MQVKLNKRLARIARRIAAKPKMPKAVSLSIETSGQVSSPEMLEERHLNKKVQDALESKAKRDLSGNGLWNVSVVFEPRSTIWREDGKRYDMKGTLRLTLLPSDKFKAAIEELASIPTR